MRRLITMVYLVALSLCAQFTLADVLKMRDGRSIQGTFLGGNARQMDFLTQAGQPQSLPIGSVHSITFSSLPPPPAAPAANTAAPPSSGASSRPAVMIPNGTPLRVRTIDTINVDVAQAGTKFRHSLDDPVMVGGAVVNPARSRNVMLQAVKVQQSGKMKGSDLIQLKINSIMAGGTSYPVVRA